MSATKTKEKADAKERVDIGLTAKARKQVIDLLSAILGDQHVLYLKTRNFHWNLLGPRFHSLHEFFEKQYQGLEAVIDKTAERIRMLGGVAPGSMREFLALATLEESAGALLDGESAIHALREDHEATVRQLRKAIDKLGEIGDAGTEDFVIALLQTHEESAWMLRSYEG